MKEFLQTEFVMHIWEEFFFPLLSALMKSQVSFRQPVISVIWSSALISRSLNLPNELSHFGVDVAFPQHRSLGLRRSKPQALLPGQQLPHALFTLSLILKASCVV